MTVYSILSFSVVEYCAIPSRPGEIYSNRGDLGLTFVHRFFGVFDLLQIYCYASYTTPASYINVGQKRNNGTLNPLTPNPGH